MNERPLRFGLIGASKIARKHAAALSRIENVEMAAVCDLLPERVEGLTREFGGQPYHDYREMLEQERLDVVSVLTPSDSHAVIAQEVAATGRHVVVEKPMALVLDDADAQIDACLTHNVRLFVVMQNRFSRPVLKLREAVETGRFGKLVLGTARLRWTRGQDYYDAASWRGTWKRDGGVFCNQACHHIDLLRWMLGDVDSVMAMKTTGLVDIEAEDTGAAILRFRNGALGIVEATTAWRPSDLEGSLAVAGEKGSVEIGGFVVDRLTHWAFEGEPAPDEAFLGEFGSNPGGFGWTHEQFLRNIIWAIREHKPALVEAMEGRKTVELINAIYESSETGQEVFLRFRPKHSRLGREKDPG